MECRCRYKNPAFYLRATILFFLKKKEHKEEANKNKGNAVPAVRKVEANSHSGVQGRVLGPLLAPANLCVRTMSWLFLLSALRVRTARLPLNWIGMTFSFNEISAVVREGDRRGRQKVNNGANGQRKWRRNDNGMEMGEAIGIGMNADWTLALAFACAHLPFQSSDSWFHDSRQFHRKKEWSF
jgi:hypothetical protein